MLMAIPVSSLRSLPNLNRSMTKDLYRIHSTVSSLLARRRLGQMAVAVQILEAWPAIQMGDMVDAVHLMDTAAKLQISKTQLVRTLRPKSVDSLPAVSSRTAARTDAPAP